LAQSSHAPARIILSRKGWDSKAGGWPSPILPGGIVMSLPIPDCDSGITYDDLYLPDGRKLVGKMVHQLSSGRVKPQDHVHLDPDIRENAIKRTTFQAAFGQCGAAQTHLVNEGVIPDEAGKNNDLFLFFGRYQEVIEHNGVWQYRPQTRDVQIIFGWLQVDQIVPLVKGFPSWAKSHPHCIPSRIVRAELGNRKVDNNTLYVARPRLSFCSKPGAGVFDHFDSQNGDPKRLTRNGSLASLWKLPGFFRDEKCKRLSNIGDGTRWTPDQDSWLVQRKGPGQEFVLETKGREKEVMAWLNTLFG